MLLMLKVAIFNNPASRERPFCPEPSVTLQSTSLVFQHNVWLETATTSRHRFLPLGWKRSGSMSSKRKSILVVAIGIG
jgi:hypothetical protein